MLKGETDLLGGAAVGAIKGRREFWREIHIKDGSKYYCDTDLVYGGEYKKKSLGDEDSIVNTW